MRVADIEIYDLDNMPQRRPISLTTAPPGFRAIIVSSDGWDEVPVIGWELVENVRTDRYGEVQDEIGAEWRPREWRVAGLAGEDGLVDLEDYYGDNYWMVLPPGAPDPTDEQAAACWARVQRTREARRRIDRDAA